MSLVNEDRFKWNFGATANSEGGDSNNSTGQGVAHNCFGLAREHTFYVESANNANSTGSYQIRTARNSSGPWAVLSSGTLSSNQQDVWQFTGPFLFFSPRVKTIQSTAGTIIIEYLGN